MDNEVFLKLKKCWTFPDKRYGEKEIYFNPRGVIDNIEPCKIRDAEGNEQQCTKIYYQTNFILLRIPIEEFFKECRAANAAVCILNDLYDKGITLKQFITTVEAHNGIDLSG